VGLPPDRAPRDDDWAWLNALAGHPEPDTEKRVLRETKLLAEALKEALGGMDPPREDLQARFEASSSLSAKDFDESSRMGVMASIESLFSSAERIRPSASFSRDSSDDNGIYPEPTGNGFARLKRRLRDAGLL
jgi:hypothetical protein